MEKFGQLTFDDNPVYVQLKKIYAVIEEGRFETAEKMLEEIINMNIDAAEIYSSLKAVKFWINRRKKIDSSPGGLSKGDTLLSEWENFEKFVSAKGIEAKKTIAAVKKFVFRSVIDNYILDFQKREVADPALLLRIAGAFLANGEYARALDTLLYARKFKKKDAQIYALLGEAHYHLKNHKKARAFFREAFFINPAQVPVESLNAEIITDLRKKIEDEGFIRKEINLWLPVFAELYDIFSVKRRLERREYDELLQRIYKNEIEYNLDRKNRAIIEPILLYQYLYLIGHYQAENAGDADLKIANVQRKIKNINGQIYELARRQQ
ncbi:MAG: hypothetical protein A2096_12440 [Spirochaetes bacterium GWF1_41_5]|nr:MAG: hypothetical protein A2096_12440 [Spirochaetes bacterium GWF1_41_5]HBE04671.1 hypothetical protein [Spirochaetia bacterium]